MICNLRQMSNRGKKLNNSPPFGGGRDTMRYSASWLSVCWAATVCCPSWLVWICWAGPDGLLKALPYGIPETLHSLHRHTQTSNCYSCYCDFHHHCCYSYASFSLSMSHIIVLLRSKIFNWFRRLVLPSFQRYCLCPTRCLVITLLHAFSGLSVNFFSNGICAIEAECSLLNTKWCSAITSSWSVGTNCLYPQTMWKMQSRIGLYHSLHFKFSTVFSSFDDTGELLFIASRSRLTVVGLHREIVLFHFSHTCCRCSYILYK